MQKSSQSMFRCCDKGGTLILYVHYVQYSILEHSVKPHFSAEQPLRDILYLYDATSCQKCTSLASEAEGLFRKVCTEREENHKILITFKVNTLTGNASFSHNFKRVRAIIVRSQVILFRSPSKQPLPLLYQSCCYAFSSVL